MNEDNAYREIGEKMVQTSCWSWRDGIRGVLPNGATVRFVGGRPVVETCSASIPIGVPLEKCGLFPDLNDGATLGAIQYGLLASRKVSIARHVFTRLDGTGQSVQYIATLQGLLPRQTTSLAEALLYGLQLIDAASAPDVNPSENP
jgi:hypothetical protein